MTKRSRCQIGSLVLVAWTGLAHAQVGAQDVQCKKTETQSECHDRLKCKADEELEDCQKRLLKCRSGESVDACEKRVGGQAPHDNAGQRGDGGSRGGDRQGGDRGGDDRGGGDRGGDDNRTTRGRDNQDDGGDRRDRGNRGSDREDSGVRRRRGGGGGGHGGFEANKTFGLGLELAEPTGLNGKVFVTPTGAIDFGVGYMYDGYYYGDGFHLYADYLWHPVLLTSAPAFDLPFYIGLGLRYWDFDYCYLGVCGYNASAVGIRVPIGLAFDFNNTPLDIFVQLVPVIDFLGGTYYDRFGDREHLGLDASVGVRFWFK